MIGRGGCGEASAAPTERRLLEYENEGKLTSLGIRLPLCTNPPFGTNTQAYRLGLTTEVFTDGGDEAQNCEMKLHACAGFQLAA